MRAFVIVFAFYWSRSHNMGAADTADFEGNKFCASFVTSRCPVLSDHFVKPVANQSLPVDVTVTMLMLYFLELNDLDQRLSMELMFKFKWHLPEDCRWDNDTNAANETTECWYTKDAIWHPKVDVWNAIGSSSGMGMLAAYGTDIAIKSDGTVQWAAKGVIDTKCPLRFTYFPYDSQYCNLALSTYQGVDDLSKSIFFTNDTAVVPAYHFTTGADVWHFDNYSIDIANFINAVNFHFYLTRNPLYYYGVIFFPNFLLTILMLASLALPADLPDRSSFGITIFLAFAMLQGSFYSSIPKASQITYMVIYLCCHNATAVFITTWSLIASRLVFRKRGRASKIVVNAILFGARFRMKLIDVLDSLIFAISLIVLVSTNVIFFASVLTNPGAEKTD